MNVTPAMQQYYDLKKQYNDSILFFRMWDFYEMFEEDAKIAHKILGINLTSRNKNAENPIALAGIPYHAKEKYLGKLIDAGYKVAIAEQVSNPKLKGIVEREVVRVITPGTLSLEEENYTLKDDTHNLCSIVSNGKNFWLSLINLSTHVWTCSEFTTLEWLSTELYKISPSEVVLEKSLFWHTELEEILIKKYALNIYYYETNIDSYSFLTQRLGLKSLSSIWIEDKVMAQKASSYILHYISENQKSDLNFLDSLSYESYSGYLELDEATIKSLDLVYNIATSSATQWTLFWVLNNTGTSMGKRYLREQILRPLQDVHEIKARQKYITLLKKNPVVLEEIRSKLKSIADIDAILTRISLERAGPRDLILLKNALVQIRDITKIFHDSKIPELKKIFTDT